MTAYVDALQAALAGEHAAVYGYGVIGGRLRAGTALQARAAGSYRLHRTRRDSLIGRIAADGTTPVQARAGYALPRPVTNEASAAVVAREMERRLCTLYSAAIAVAAPAQRAYAVDGVLSCSAQELLWGAPSSALPGLR